MISFDAKKNSFFRDDDDLYGKRESTSSLYMSDSLISFPFVADESFVWIFEEEEYKKNLNDSIIENFCKCLEGNFCECKENMNESKFMENCCEYKKNLNESKFMENCCFNIEENNDFSYLNDRIEKNKIDFPKLIFLSNEDSFSFDIKNEDTQQVSNNSNQTKNSNLTQNNSKSSTKESSEIGSNGIINPNKKENIFKVEHFDDDFLKSNLNNSSINLFYIKKKKKEKIQKENKIDIRKETLDKIIFRRLFKFIRTNSEKDEISDIIKKDKSFFEEFLKNGK